VVLVRLGVSSPVFLPTTGAGVKDPCAVVIKRSHSSGDKKEGMEKIGGLVWRIVRLGVCGLMPL